MYSEYFRNKKAFNKKTIVEIIYAKSIIILLILENVKCQMRAQLLELLEEEDPEKLLAMLDLKTEEKQQEFLESRELFLRQRHANHELFEKNTGEFYERLRSIGGNKVGARELVLLCIVLPY